MNQLSLIGFARMLTLWLGALVALRPALPSGGPRVGACGVVAGCAVDTLRLHRHVSPRARMIRLQSPELLETLPADSESAEAIVCARGVCVLADEDQASELCYLDEDGGGKTCVPNPNVSQPDIASLDYLWPRALLLGCSVLYGTNFPLGRLMNEALPASAATSARFVLAGLALSPFLAKLSPQLRLQGVLCGSFTAMGYISQSIALEAEPSATVAFLGALIVVWCPLLAAFVDRTPMGFKEAPQTWLAAALALSGVGVLELAGSGENVFASVGSGDLWAVLQAIGFGTSFFITEKMMAKASFTLASFFSHRHSHTSFSFLVTPHFSHTSFAPVYGTSSPFTARHSRLLRNLRRRYRSPQCSAASSPSTAPSGQLLMGLG